MKGKGINRQPLRQTELSVRISIIIETCPVNSVVFWQLNTRFFLERHWIKNFCTESNFIQRNVTLFPDKIKKTVTRWLFALLSLWMCLRPPAQSCHLDWRQCLLPSSSASPGYSLPGGRWFVVTSYILDRTQLKWNHISYYYWHLLSFIIHLTIRNGTNCGEKEASR